MAAWRSGLRVRLKIRRAWVRIPLGCKVVILCKCNKKTIKNGGYFMFVLWSESASRLKGCGFKSRRGVSFIYGVVHT
jgi:hypothetical protein